MRKRRIAKDIEAALASLESDLFVSEDIIEVDDIEETMPEENLVEEADDTLEEEIEEIEEVLIDEESDPLDDEIEVAFADDDDLDDEIEAAFAENDDVEEDLEQQIEAAIQDLDDESLEASEVEPGVEDTISDTAVGGDPTVQEVVPQGDEAKKMVQEDSEVFPTNSEYVAKLVDRLDKVASVLENDGKQALALRIDKVSDYLEANIK